MKNLPPTKTKIIAYSDACGGQNKNKHISKLFMYIVRSTHIKEIHHKFFEPGHSYMECDRSFGIIEKRRKRNPQVFIPSHWRDIIQMSSKKFVVVHMEAENFVAFSAALNTIIKDPKTDSDKHPLQWRGIRWFLYQTDLPYTFKFKRTLDVDFPFGLSENCQITTVGRPSRIIFQSLHPEGNKIKLLKWKNLQEQLQFIPPIYHEFYINLPHEDNANKRSSQYKNSSEHVTSKRAETSRSKKKSNTIEIQHTPRGSSQDNNSEWADSDNNLIDSDYD